MLQRRHVQPKKVPAKLNKLKSAQLCKKDVMRSQVTREKMGSVQSISNPMRSSSHYFAEKPVHSQIIDGHVSVYRDRNINFDKQQLTSKINENRAKGFIAVKKASKQTDVSAKIGTH